MRKQEREEVKGQGKGMTAIRVGSPEHFLEEAAFERSLEDAPVEELEFGAGRG